MRWSNRSLLAFLACGLALWAVLNLAGRIAIVEPTRVQTMHAAYDAIAGKDAVSLGGSVATAVDFQAMCLSGTNFFNNGQDLFEVEAIVERILADPAPPKIFFLTIIPGAQKVDNGRPPLDGSWARKSTYRFLQERGDWTLIGGDWRQSFLAQAMPATGEFLTGQFYGLILRETGRLPPPDPAIAADTGAIAPRSAAATAMASARGVAVDTKGIRYYDPARAARSQAALRRIEARLAARGRTLVIVIAPVTRVMARAMMATNPAVVSEFYAGLSQLDGDRVAVLDSWRDPRYANRYPLFRDNQHLNAPGARVFSGDLAKILERRGIVRRNECLYDEG